MPVYCPACSSHNPPAATQCRTCGTALAWPFHARPPTHRKRWEYTNLTIALSLSTEGLHPRDLEQRYRRLVDQSLRRAHDLGGWQPCGPIGINVMERIGRVEERRTTTAAGGLAIIYESVSICLRRLAVPGRRLVA
jgi:hypothetical protein